MPTDTANAALTEREQFERFALSNGYAYSDPQYGVMFYDALPKVIAWKAWSAARAQPTPPAVGEPLTDEQIADAFARETEGRPQHPFFLGIRFAERHHGIKKGDSNA